MIERVKKLLLDRFRRKKLKRLAKRIRRDLNKAVKVARVFFDDYHSEDEVRGMIRINKDMELSFVFDEEGS